jgi:ATP-dependent DNA helicase RecQ
MRGDCFVAKNAPRNDILRFTGIIMPPNLDTALHDHFGFAAFRVGQREAMLAALARRDALVVMPTGSGKSLCYQLSALLLPDVTLVLSPLIALMKDQVDALAARQKPATFINSTLDANEQRARLNALAQGASKIVYVAPERLRNADFRATLKETRVSLLAVDEAHCISQWGHDFRPDYLRIREFAEAIGRPPVIALTATATPQVQTDIVTQLGLVRAEKIVTGFNRPNLVLRVRYTPNESAKYRELEKILRATPGSVIIYAGTRAATEDVAGFCTDELKIRAAFYHAGMDDDARTRTQDAFMRGEIPIIAATNAFGMGVDKSDIRAVIHFALPSTVEAYYQEIGRAGRDGEPARVVLLYSPEDRALQEWFIENDAPEEKQVRQLYQMLTRVKSNWIAPTILQRETGLNDSKLQLALHQLEIANVLKRLGDARGLIGFEIDATAQLDLTASQADLERRRAHRRKLLARMIEYAETNACRRKFILNYFGDHGLATAPDCCDNHAAATIQNARPVETEEDKVPLILLEIVRTLKYPVGRNKLALIAKGSRAQEVPEYGRAHRYYGKLADYSLAQLEALVDQLFQRGFLKTIGGEYPVVAMSAHGADALRQRLALDLDVPPLPSQEKRDEKRATRDAGGTIQRTLELAQTGCAPAEIAQQRGLTINTIYDHLAQLIGAGTVELNAIVPSENQEQIRAALRQASGNSLTEVKLLLPETIAYGEIRCVIAAGNLQTRGPTPQKIASDDAPLAPADENLFAALREWRFNLARQEQLPAFVIFHDKTLRAIARARPRTVDALMCIEGIGERKAARYGAAVLEICARVI